MNIIGTTAHYVMPDRDEGPIVEQDSERVDHTMTADDLAAAGRDIETRCLPVRYATTSNAASCLTETAQLSSAEMAAAAEANATVPKGAVTSSAGTSTTVSAKLIDGKAQAAAIVAEVTTGSALLATRPGLSVVLVGDDPASAVYVRNKNRTAEACGFSSVQHSLPADTGQARLIALVEALNADPAVHGILVQLPLPASLDAAAVIAAIDPDKDVDGLTVVNAGRLTVGDPAAIVPCTPAGSMHLIRSIRGADLSGLSAVVVGRSRLVGLPMALLLAQANATVTIAHSRTANLFDLTARADILVAAVGRAQMIRGDAIKSGATVIDVGINRIADPAAPSGTRLVGDVAFAEAGHAGAITPVPGGVGPMTIAMLMANTLGAAQKAQRLR